MQRSASASKHHDGAARALTVLPPPMLYSSLSEVRRGPTPSSQIPQRVAAINAVMAAQDEELKMNSNALFEGGARPSHVLYSLLAAAATRRWR